MVQTVAITEAILTLNDVQEKFKCQISLLS